MAHAGICQGVCLAWILLCLYDQPTIIICVFESGTQLREVYTMDPSRKSGGALHRLHCLCLEFDGACEVQRRVPTDWIIEPIDVSGHGSFSLAS